MVAFRLYMIIPSTQLSYVMTRATQCQHHVVCSPVHHSGAGMGGLNAVITGTGLERGPVKRVPHNRPGKIGAALPAMALLWRKFFK